MRTLHIIPHTHWDREWYMGFEQHRMKLVQLMDTLIETMEQNPEYTYFHLDGQYIVIEDYLAIRPNMRDRLVKLLKDDRIQIGPWYVLQDEYLTSGESNIRNLQTGLRLCREIGAEPVLSGYFPDAFGNISQAPQILRGFGIDNAVFGRGINEIQFDNQIVEGKKSNPSEWRWRSPDGSEVIGVMFAHWYHNAMELPDDKTKLKQRMQSILDSTTASAATPHLLGMNGCDHEPVQVNLPKVLDMARELFAGEDTTFQQSNFKKYMEAIRPYRENFPIIEGELNGQKTNGYGLLINTASTHVPLKQKNYKAQNMLEQQAEPLNVLSWLAGDIYRSDLLLYSWKTLMQNHPHDSICCCSVDEVTREMSMRFDKSMQVSTGIRQEAIDFLCRQIDTSALEDENIVVFHTAAGTDTQVITAYVDLDETVTVAELYVMDIDGNLIPSAVTPRGRVFTYHLPKSVFRKSKWVNRYEIRMLVTETGVGYRTYRVMKGKAPRTDTLLKVYENGAENETLAFTIQPDGSLSITDKRSGICYKGLNIYEDSGDKGESYNYSSTEDAPLTTLGAKARSWVEEYTDFSVTFGIEVCLEVPAGLENGERSHRRLNHKIITCVTLTSGIDRLDIKTTMENKVENHRLRALFQPKIQTDYSLADSQFDVVKRPVQPYDGWLNPSNCQRCQAFFSLENQDKGLLIATHGLHEYEILRDGQNTMALTLLRCIGEVGDWGYFPTKDMQCKGEHTFSYSIVPYDSVNRDKAFAWGYEFQRNNFSSSMVCRQEGVLPALYQFVRMDGRYITMSAFKKCEDRESTILRICNIHTDKQTVHLYFNHSVKRIFQTDLSEERQEELLVHSGEVNITIPGKKIVTLEICCK